MPDAAAVERANEYKQTLAATARRLGVKPTDERAQTVAVLQWNMRLLREQVLARGLNGQVTDPAILLKLQEALVEYLPAAPVEHSRVTLKVSRTHYGICQRCGYEHSVRGDDVPAAGTKRAKRKSAGHRPNQLATAIAKRKPSNVVSLDRSKARDIHHGEHAALKQEVARDPYMGGFTAPRRATAHPAEPLPEPSK
jgi:hypothetical protein